MEGEDDERDKTWRNRQAAHLCGDRVGFDPGVGFRGDGMGDPSPGRAASGDRTPTWDRWRSGHC